MGAGAYVVVGACDTIEVDGGRVVVVGATVTVVGAMVVVVGVVAAALLIDDAVDAEDVTVATSAVVVAVEPLATLTSIYICETYMSTSCSVTDLVGVSDTR